MQKYSYKSLLYNVYYNSGSFYNVDEYKSYNKESITYLLQKVFIYYKTEQNINFFNNYSLFLEKIEDINFQKELYFIINYLDSIHNTGFVLRSLKLSEINSFNWFYS